MSRIISFCGADHKCGCTQLALSTAYCLSRNKDLQIMFVNASGEPFNPYCSGSEVDFEKLRPNINKDLFVKEDIVENSKYKENLSIIGGIGFANGRGDFHPDNASFFIKNLGEVYDFVICDCGSSPENGLAFGTMLASDAVFLLVNQSECTLRKYEWISGLYKKLNLPVRAVVLNKYDRGSSYDYSYVSKRLNPDKCGLIKIRKSAYGEKAEINGEALWDLGGSSFRADIVKLTERFNE